MTAFRIPESKRAGANASKGANDQSEFDGIYINFGPSTESTTEDGEVVTEFHRLPLGVELSRLRKHQLYANSDPEWAKKAQLVNSIIDALQKRAGKLDEGEGTKVNLDVYMYKRQEAVEAVSTATDSSAVEAQLFGDDD